MSSSKQNSNETVLVVGGGVIGVATAHYLNQLGYQVTVIDQAEMGKGSSYANCGYICPSHVLPLAEPGMIKVGIKSLFNPKAALKIKPQLRLALYQWLFQFARRCNHEQMIATGHSLKTILDDSRAEYDLLFNDTELQAQWKKTGLFYVLKTAKGVEAFKATDQLISDVYNLKAQFIDGADLPEFEGSLKPGLAGGFLYKNDASVEPALLVKNWISKLASEGVVFMPHCKLHQLNKNSNRIASVLTNKGELIADHFVFATGAWSSQLAKHLGCDIPVEPCKGYSVTIDRPENCPEVPMLFPEHRVGVTPFDDSFRLGSMMDFTGFDNSINPKRIEQLYDSAKPYLHSSFNKANALPWSGWRPMTWDSLPIIDHVPKLNNALLVTGHSMLGLTLAPGTGKLVADLLSGRTPSIDPAPFSANRF